MIGSIWMYNFTPGSKCRLRLYLSWLLKLMYISVSLLPVGGDVIVGQVWTCLSLGSMICAWQVANWGVSWGRFWRMCEGRVVVAARWEGDPAPLQPPLRAPRVLQLPSRSPPGSLEPGRVVGLLSGRVVTAHRCLSGSDDDIGVWACGSVWCSRRHRVEVLALFCTLQGNRRRWEWDWGGSLLAGNKVKRSGIEKIPMCLLSCSSAVQNRFSDISNIGWVFLQSLCHIYDDTRCS